MKNYSIKFEHKGMIIYTTERAFTFKGAYRKAVRKAQAKWGK